MQTMKNKPATQLAKIKPTKTTARLEKSNMLYISFSKCTCEPMPMQNDGVEYEATICETCYLVKINATQTSKE